MSVDGLKGGNPHEPSGAPVVVESIPIGVRRAVDALKIEELYTAGLATLHDAGLHRRGTKILDLNHLIHHHGDAIVRAASLREEVKLVLRPKNCTFRRILDATNNRISGQQLWHLDKPFEAVLDDSFERDEAHIIQSAMKPSPLDGENINGLLAERLKFFDAYIASLGGIIGTSHNEYAALKLQALAKGTIIDLKTWTILDRSRHLVASSSAQVPFGDFQFRLPSLDHVTFLRTEAQKERHNNSEKNGPRLDFRFNYSTEKKNLGRFREVVDLQS